MWLGANKLSLDVCEDRIICSSPQVKDWLSFTFESGRYVLKVKVKDNKILVVYIDESLMWSKHIEEITKKITGGISALKRLGDFASRDVLVSVIVSKLCFSL